MVVRLQEESDVLVLRQAVHILDDENRKLQRQVVRLSEELSALKGEAPEQLRLKLIELQQQLDTKNKMLFGDSSEKRSGDKKKRKKRDKQTGHGPRPQPELRIVEQSFDFEQTPACDLCGGELVEWTGQHEEAEEIDVIERQFVIKKCLRKKYRCKCGGCVKTAPGPLKLVKGGRYSVDFAVEIATSKYLDHLPLERQVRIMRREGLETDSQTLWDQLNRLAHLLAPGYEALAAYVLSHDVIGADETHWKLMGSKGKGKTKRWQVWATCATDAVCYQIHDSRSTAAARAVLGDYEGVVMCDGYRVYSALAKENTKMVLAHCWSHVRRDYLKAEEHAPEQVAHVLELIGKLYEIETRCPTGPPGDPMRTKLRDTESRAIVKQVHDWALEVEALPKSPLGEALKYMAGIWTGLTRFLDNPKIPLDNNGTERGLRGIVIGRKNHYGSRSKRGTEVAALFYSLLESAKLAGVEPKAYLRRAVFAALRGEAVPLPHEVVATA